MAIQGSSQCVDFNINSNVCQNENLDIEVADLGEYYLWDFCEGDLSNTPVVTLKSTFSEIGESRSLTLVNDSTNWYGFAVDRTANSLLRINYGNTLQGSIPTITDLGNIDDSFDVLESIKILNENGSWYGIVYSSGSNSLFRLDFGSTLTNTPTTSLILNSVGDIFSSLDYSISNDSLIIVLSNFNTSNFTVVNLSESINNTPTVSDYFNFSGVAFPSDIKLFNQCDNWYGISAASIAKKAYLLDYGTSLFTTPTITEIGTTIFPDKPRKFEIVKDNNEYIIVVVSETGRLHRINIGDDLSSITPIYTDLGINSGMTNTYSMAMVKESSSWFGYSMHYTNGRLYEIKFQNDCNVNTSTSVEQNPTEIKYTSSGNYNVGLTIYDIDGNLLDSKANVIPVSTSIAPEIDFSSENVCVTSDITFTGVNNNSETNPITTWLWDFGDGMSDSGSEVIHNYSTAGTYQVKLSVDSNNGCKQLFYNAIKIYDEPIPDFSVPGGTICTNQPYSFVNTTPDNFDGLLSYEWQLDGATVSNATDLDITFLTGGAKELKLITTIPGCSVEMAKSLTNIKPGILPQFTFDDSCVGEAVAFNYTSIGTPTVIAWDFGNGFNSSLPNPSLEYATEGTYDVTLTLTNADGCVTFDTQSITIHPLPKVSFSNELACEMLETQFSDLSSVTLDNLSAWTWNFGDQSVNSTDQNPLHFFANAGDYNVKLITESTFGCIDSLQQIVSVLEAPQAAFSLDKICIDVPIQFTDASSPVAGQNIINWAWNIGGAFNSNQNPEVTFGNALDYTISLTVTSDNLCTSTQSQSIFIAPAPTLAFEVSDDCENQTALLTDITDITGDTINDWAWNLGSQSIGTGNQISNAFPKAGNYDVSLSILTENGCNYEITQAVPIHEVPVAVFSTSFPFGAPPFIVDFTNQSTGATNYVWSFEEGANSIEAEPSYTFQNLGDFDVELVAINDQNCSDTTTWRIEVLQPLLDLEVRNISLVPDINSDILSITVRNNGTIRMDSLKVGINLGGELDLFEKIKTQINPDETITTQLSLQLVNKKLDYICVSISSYLVDIEDYFISNNDKCVTFDNQDIIIFPPYPNPVSNEVKFEVITTTNQLAVIEIVNSGGASVSTFQTELESGSNNLSFNLEALENGLYLIRINIGGRTNLFKVILGK